MRYGAAERAAALCALLLGLLTTGQAQAQPTLHIGGASAVVVEGREIDGAAAYPARTLESLGFRMGASQAGVLAVLGSDTLRFWNTSPYFRSGSGLQQLAYPARDVDGIIYLPEQFFIQWLPSTYPDRFEFRGGTLIAGSRAVTTASRTLSARESAPQPAAPVRAPRVVVIDPGHGGRDPGKVGPNGLLEKDVTLMMSQRLAAILEERGYEVHLTRTTDTYISLYDRPRLANEWKGNRPVAVFLSIHANSAPASSARGYETFFLSDARTDDERRVAEMENESLRFDDHGPSAPQAELDQVLSTLRSDFLMRASHDLASVIQQHMAGFHPGPNRGVKRAGFVVLVGTVMPAVLVETGFMSNRDEARLLGTQSFQQKVAWGIADSVDEFFSLNEHLWETGR